MWQIFIRLWYPAGIFTAAKSCLFRHRDLWFSIMGWRIWENEVLKNCKTLSEYAQFVAMVRENKETMEIEEAITKAVNDCIRLNILKDFLKRHKAEMKKISIYEYDAEQQRIFDREEGRDEGSSGKKNG